MKKLMFSLFLLFSVFFIACSEDTTDPCDKCTPEQYCQSGVCLSYQCSPEHPEGVCKSGEHCDGTQCVPSICSTEYPNGQCANDNEHCVNGVCEEYECSILHPDGICPQGEVCLANHTCGTIDCSPENPNGQCQNGYQCSADGNCEPLPCSITAPNGKCEDDKDECVNGECLPKDRCSEDNPHGICALHQRCMDGTCKDINCGPGNPDGACEEGQYCNRVLQSGEWSYACEDVPQSCTQSSECPDGYKCDTDTNKCIEYVCDPQCQQYEICRYGMCQPDTFFCSSDSQNGWCEDGLECIDGTCQVHVYNPCEEADCGNDYCIVTDPNSDTGYECVGESELCSESNTTGKCNAPQVCKDGVCTDVNPCDTLTCDEGQVCDPTAGACIENYCMTHPDACTVEHTICVNKFGEGDPFSCPCELGYDWSFTENKCIQNNDACTGKDCGEGICITDDWAVDGWYCECNTGMEYLDENIKHLCIDSSTYNYCTNWDCGVGTCEEVTEENHKYAICNCPENFYFNSEEKTCVPGVVCGNTFCDNPLRQACIDNQFCEDQPCSANYPEGACGNAESCVNGVCELTEECSAATSAGYCMDGYSCRTGICCKGGNCTTTDATLKQINETCDLETNNCVNDAICVPTPTGDGICHKLCDQTRADSCSDLNTGNTIYHCVGRNVFDGVNYDKIGVCAVDDNCSRADNGGCYSNQVCLGFRRTNFTQCYAFEENVPLGASCTTGTVSVVIDNNNNTRPGFNIGCGENLLCVDGTCVPDCLNKHKISTPENINICYESFAGDYRIENLKVKDQEDLTFESVENHKNISTCNPANDTCSGGSSCIKIQDKNSTSGTSKDIGVCTETCNFDSSDYSSECNGTAICFKSDNTPVCLKSSDCNPINSQGCGENVCYPVTSALNACMTTVGLGHVGEDCSDSTCQDGLCVNGICTYPCSIGDNSSCETGETCQSTTDPYLNSSSHFGNPSTYGICQ